MQAGNAATVLLRRRLLMLEPLRVLINIEINVRTECRGLTIRRIFVTEPDASGCNWQVDWPTVHAAIAEPCRAQLRAVIEEIRERYNVAQ